MKAILISAALALCTGAVLAKLPPSSDEAKAKAAESAAKTAHAGKVGGYQLCMSMDKVAAAYLASSKTAGKDVKAPVATPACQNPGAFVYTPATPAAATTTAAAATTPVKK